MLVYSEVKEESVIPEKLDVVDYGTRRKLVTEKCAYGKLGMIEHCLSDIDGSVLCHFAFMHFYTYYVICDDIPVVKKW